MTISTELNTLGTAIADIKTEIAAKGQSVISTDTVCSLAPKITNISNINGEDYSKTVLSDIVEGTIEYLYDTELKYIRPYCFTGCINLRKVRFINLRKICRHAFEGCYNLKYLILDFYNSNNTNEIVKLENVNALKYTLISKNKGKIYVRDELYTKYKADTNWSYYTSSIYKISELTE